MKTEELATILRNNPGALLTLDNDDWWLYAKPFKPVEDMTDDEHDQWASNTLAKGRDFGYETMLLALASLADVTVEKV
jgi:hypothetical protein